MSLYDKASLIMTPSGVKAEKLYSHKPHNGNGDFTHDRNAGTATRVNKDGLIETVAADVPRLNYPLIDGVVQDNPHFLLEPARTNLFEQSNKYDTYWTLSNITVTSGQTGIGGNSEAWKITASSGGGEKKLNKNLAVSGNHAISIYAKKGTKDYIWLRGVTSGANKRVFFNLAYGTVGTDQSVSSKITDMGDGWYRCEAVFNQQSGFEFFIGIAESDNTPFYTDDGTGTIYVQYAQAEAGSYATSYIPTSGTTVTRNADVCNSAGTSAEFNDSEGVLYVESAALANDGNLRFITINDGNYTDRVAIAYTSSDNQLRLQVTVGGSDSYLKLQSINDAKEFNKISLKYKASDFVIWINGFEYHTQSSGSVFPIGTLDSLSFDNGAGGSPFYGKTKELAVFKEALTDSELEALTSWTSFNEMATGQEYTIR